MAAPTIYRSTDTNAPVLFGGPGALITVLDAILKDGYGSAFAAGSLTQDGTNVADGDTVTVGSITYTYKTTPSAPYHLNIGGSAGGSQLNLQFALNGNGITGSNYFTGTLANPDAYGSSIVGSVLTVVARKGGSAGNSIALARASAGTAHIAVSGATLTGGGGTNTKAGAGWTKPYSGAGANAALQGVYKQPAGCGFYVQVDDVGTVTAGGREAKTAGFETMTAYGVGTGQFPTVAQALTGIAIRKSNTLDGTTRAWVCFVDDRTFYLLTADGSTAGAIYQGYGFGDFYSLQAGDLYKCMIMGSITDQTSSMVTNPFGQATSAGAQGCGGHYEARNSTGVGGSSLWMPITDYGLIYGGGASAQIAGNLMFPNQSDGGLYIAPIRMIDSTTPGQASATAMAGGGINLRGRLRGMSAIASVPAAFVDGDTFVGSGDYVGRNFVVAKQIVGLSSSTGLLLFETTPWETST